MAHARVRCVVVSLARGGFRIGKLISVHEGITSPEPIFAQRSFALAEKGGDAAFAPEIEPGSQEVKVNITLTYEIK